MLQINKGFLALSMLMAFSLSAMENQIVLIHERNDFRVESLEGSFPVQRCYMDKELRGISSETLAKYAAVGARLELNKLSGDGHQYALKLNGRLNGGGPITANILYWTVKGLGYGVPATVAATTIVTVAAPLVAAGGTIGAAAGGIGAGTSALIGGTATAAAGAGAAMTGGAIVGEVIIGAVGLEAAAVGTAGALGAGATSGAYVVAVESAAVGAFGAGLACWFLP